MKTQPVWIGLGLGVLVLAGVGFLGDVGAQERRGLPEGPKWGRGRFQPEATNVLFATADGCALCHSASRLAAAMRSDTGEDVSPHGLWRGTMMANSFRDPYWRAQVSREIAAAPERADEIQALCMRCHAPMTHHTARIAGTKTPSVREASTDGLARDGVSCTVCHQAQDGNLGTQKSFSGQLDIRPGRKIFGPYPEPAGRPMEMHSAFRPTQGTHIRKSALCASCHTLFTSPGEGHAPFPEQTPYLEWRNSIFSDEAGPTATSRTCQECHMANVGTMRIARNPPGGDFNMDARPDVRAHAFVGGNTLLLRMFRDSGHELKVTAPQSAFERMEYATRRNLREATADLEITAPERKDGRLVFDVTVRNRTGHKFPTGYPARRAWLRVEVRAGRQSLFASGRFDGEGRITGVKDERAIPHTDRVTAPDQVVVYECIPVDTDGAPTTLQHSMAKQGKDTRLLPDGWRADGPHAAQTLPVGTEEDDDFVGGSDTVTYDVRLPADAPDRLMVVAWLLYQPVPPAWVDPLRTVDTEEAKLFVRLYDAADVKPETVSVRTRFEGE